MDGFSRSRGTTIVRLGSVNRGSDELGNESASDTQPSDSVKVRTDYLEKRKGIGVLVLPEDFGD